jgi:hypothetical protein
MKTERYRAVRVILIPSLSVPASTAETRKRWCDVLVGNVNAGQASGGRNSAAAKNAARSNG